MDDGGEPELPGYVGRCPRASHSFSRLLFGEVTAEEHADLRRWPDQIGEARK